MSNRNEKNGLNKKVQSLRLMTLLRTIFGNANWHNKTHKITSERDFVCFFELFL